MLKKWPWFMLAIIVVVLDQLTKLWAQSTLDPYEASYVLSFFNITLAYNTGAAFSFLTSAGNWHKWLFTIVSFFISFLISAWIVRLPANDKWQLSGLSLVLGGAVGNLIDRLARGHVIDFLDLHYQHYHWPIFNVADIAICIGAFLLLGELFFQRKKRSLHAD